VVGTAAAAEGSRSRLYLHHADQIGTGVVAVLQLVYKLVLSVSLQHELVDRTDYLLVGYLVVQTLHLAEVVQLDPTTRLETVETAGAIQ
jgi:hypothetical protein